MLARCHAVLLRFETNLLRALLGGNPPTGKRQVQNRLKDMLAFELNISHAQIKVT